MLEKDQGTKYFYWGEKTKNKEIIILVDEIHNLIIHKNQRRKRKS